MTNKKQLLIIDTSALFHRAWHALPPLTTPSGEPIQAIFGLANLLLRVLTEIKPNYVIAALDSPVKTFRHDLSEAYKATRPEPPPDLKSQFPKVTELLFSLNIPMLSADGFEADDVIGTVVNKIRIKNPEISILILTGDKDVWQLIDEQTTVLSLKKGVSELERIDSKNVYAKFGVEPKHIPDFKALAGDASDNIAGIQGVGEKTTFSLLSKYGSLDGLYKAINVTNDDKMLIRLKQKLEENKKEVELFHVLATIRKDAPVVFTIKDFLWHPENAMTAKDTFVKWGFTSLLKKLGNKEENSKEKAKENDISTEEAIVEAEHKGIFPPEIARIERELIPIFKEMTETGILIDLPYLKNLAIEIKEKKEKLKKDLYELAGQEFNPGSSDQVRDILVKILGNQTKRLRKTPGGKASTAVRELKRLGQSEPFVEKILVWRETAKLLSTYIDALPKAISPRDGRIHTTFLQLGTATGRISSAKPNLQNIPTRSDVGHSIRNAFIASENRVLLSSDYSQIELRVIAHLSSDPLMIEAFKGGEDIHKLTASKIFGVSLDQVTSAMRGRAKTLNFGILYGMGPRRLAEETDMNEEEAAEFIAQYFAQFPAVARWIEDTKKFVLENGFVETMFGRKRFIPEMFSSKRAIVAQAERSAVNTPIQGSAADIVKIALIKCEELFHKDKIDGDILLQVHDEILFEINEKDVEKIAPKIKKTMEEAVKLSVPLEVTMAVGKRWGSMVLWK